MWQKNNSLIAKIMLFMSGLLVLSGIILLTLLRYTGDVLAENRQKEIGHLLNIYETSLEYGLNSTDNNLLSIARNRNLLRNCQMRKKRGDTMRQQICSISLSVFVPITIRWICSLPSVIMRTMCRMPVQG